MPPTIPIGFHASKVPLKTGDPVPTSEPFFAELETKRDKRHEVELLLEEARPTACPPRRLSVYLFEDIHFAKKWAVQKQRKLFGAENEATVQIFKGDWNWLMIIGGSIDTNRSAALADAQNYWASKPTAKPVWELLLPSATVLSEVIISPAERIELMNAVLRGD